MKNLRFTTLTREGGKYAGVMCNDSDVFHFDIAEKLSNFSPILDEMSRKYNVLLMVNYGYQDCTIKSLLHLFEKEIQRSRSFSYSEDLFHQKINFTVGFEICRHLSGISSPRI